MRKNNKESGQNSMHALDPLIGMSWSSSKTGLVVMEVGSLRLTIINFQKH